MSKEQFLSEMNNVNFNLNMFYWIAGGIALITIIVIVALCLTIGFDRIVSFSQWIVPVIAMVSIVVSALISLSFYAKQDFLVYSYLNKDNPTKFDIVELDGIEYMQDGDELLSIEGLEVRMVNTKEKYVLATKIEAVPEHDIEEQYKDIVLCIPAKK